MRGEAGLKGSVSRYPRSIPRTTSLGRTGAPVEYRSPRRSRNVYVRPPSVGVGIEVARSGTIDAPSSPPIRLNATSPPLLRLRTCQLGRPEGVGARLGTKP